MELLKIIPLGEVNVGDIVKGQYLGHKLRIDSKRYIDQGELKGMYEYTATYLEGHNKGERTTILSCMPYIKEDNND